MAGQDGEGLRFPLEGGLVFFDLKKKPEPQLRMPAALKRDPSMASHGREHLYPVPACPKFPHPICRNPATDLSSARLSSALLGSTLRLETLNLIITGTCLTVNPTRPSAGKAANHL